MEIKKIIKRPLLYARLVFYFVFGQLFGKLLFPKLDYNSRWFQSLGGTGWQWIWDGFIWQKIFGINRHVPWPVSSRIISISNHENISFHMDDLNNFQTGGNYFQSFGKITIGRGTYIAPNVGLITQNHDFSDLDKGMEAKSIVIGEKCWIGMNSMVLPGVHLANNTIVGAGSVVTKSFFDEGCIIAGNPAVIIKKINNANK